jgi:hypothetical protein
MINEIKLFLFVLSIVYELKFIIQFLYQLTRENPEELKLKEWEKTILYFTNSYIITYILI